MKTTFAVYCGLIVAVWTTPASAQSNPAHPPTFTRPVEGQLFVGGSSAASDTYTVVRVKVFAPDGSEAQSIDGLVQVKRDFIVALQTALTAGQSVEVCAVADGVEIACSNPVTVSGAVPAPGPAAQPTLAAASANSCAEGSDNGKYGPIAFDPFTTGAMKLSGSSPVATARASICVNGALQKLDNDSTGATDTAVSAGKWTAQLKNAVKSGDLVRVIIIAAGPLPVRLSLDEMVPASCTAPLQFTASPKEGQTHIYGAASPSSDVLKCVVSVYINGDAATVVDNQGHDASSVATDSTGQFSAGLKAGLDPGQCVALVQFAQGQHASAGNIAAARQCNASGPVSTTVPAQLASSYLDLGRARTSFSTGVVMSANGGNFNSQNLFLSFTYDKNWLWGGPAPASAMDGKAAGKTKRLMVNTFFDVRLTSVPVNTIDCTVAANAALPACKSTATPSTTTPVPATPLDTFITSRKAAELRGGAYLPVITTTWTHDRDPYAFTIGPIAEAGFISPTDTVDVNGNSVASLSSQTFYTSYGFGARVGLSKLSFSHDVAPELVSYFDVVSGRFSQFDNNQLPYGADPATYRFHRPWRFAFEGAFKIPTLPFAIGVSANVHQNFGLGSSGTVGNAKDDLRFFFGTRFDVGALLGKLKTPN